MLGDAIRNLKLDRRLAGRREWLKGGELEAALAELPDLADKAATGDELEAGAGEEPGAGS